MQKYLTNLICASALTCLIPSITLGLACSTQTETPAESTAVLVLEHDGCKVYRFDYPAGSGNAKFFVKCADNRSSTYSREWCGKHCTKEESIETLASEEPECTCNCKEQGTP